LLRVHARTDVRRLEVALLVWLQARAVQLVADDRAIPVVVLPPARAICDVLADNTLRQETTGSLRGKTSTWDDVARVLVLECVSEPAQVGELAAFLAELVDVGDAELPRLLFDLGELLDIGGIGGASC